MMHPRFRRLVASIALVASVLSACAGDPSVAGNYVFEETVVGRSTSYHIRRTLTLRPDRSWLRTDVSERNGKPASSSSDSGSFSFHKARVVLRSETHGITKFRVVGDTLWSDTSEEERISQLIDGRPAKMDQFFFVRERWRSGRRPRLPVTRGR